jgi:uncharacterized OB-fold protein
MEIEKIAKRFYDELENGKFYGRKCTKCGAVEFPPVIACNTCGCPTTEWHEISGKGKMYNFDLPTDGLGVSDYFADYGEPYVCAWVEIDEGVKRCVNVIGVTKDNAEELLDKLRAKESIPVRIRAMKRDEGYTSFAFELD